MSKSQVHQRGPTAPEMNITPLIDVVFLLIIFFMLVNNIVSDENVPLIPPSLDDSQARELGEVKKITISVAPGVEPSPERRLDPLLISGESAYIRVGTHAEEIPINNMDRVTELLKDAVERGPRDAEGNTALEVRLRADGAIFYKEMQQIMAAITAAGIQTVNMVAFLEDQD